MTKTMNVPEKELPKRIWRVHSWLPGREGTDRLRHVGNVEAVDYGSAQSQANQTFNGVYDYIEPPSKTSITEAKLGFKPQLQGEASPPRGRESKPRGTVEGDSITE